MLFHSFFWQGKISPEEFINILPIPRLPVLKTAEGLILLCFVQL